MAPLRSISYSFLDKGKFIFSRSFDLKIETCNFTYKTKFIFTYTKKIASFCSFSSDSEIMVNLHFKVIWYLGHVTSKIKSRLKIHILHTASLQRCKIGSNFLQFCKFWQIYGWSYVNFRYYNDLSHWFCWLWLKFN